MTNILKKNLDKIYELSFNLSNQAIYWIDTKGNLLFANENALTNLGYTLKQLQKLKVWDVDYTVNTKEKYLQALNSFRNQEIKSSNVIQTYHKRKNQELFPVEVVTKFETIDGVEYVISYAKDITYRLQRTEQINLYFELINSSRDMIFLVDLQTGQIEFVNDIVCKSLGYTFDELKNMKINEIRKPLKGEQEIDLPEVFSRLEKEKNLITLGSYTTKDGLEIFVETSLHLKDYLGKKYITAISRDISERIEIENKKEDLNNKLNQYNKRLEEEVEKVKKELMEYEGIMKKQSKMAAMGEMIENIAHQWRQPLSAVSVLSSGMILQNDEGLLDKELLSTNLNKIHDQTQYLSKTIDDFRNFFKPDKEKSLFKVDQTIKDSLKLIKSRYNNLKIEFICKLQELELYSYENELLQVLLNILSNAVDELNLKDYEKVIIINSYKEDTYFVIEIKDNAGGISESIIDRIFEPYFTTKHKYHGTGIGLYMSENIIRHLHGKLEVKNDIIEYNSSIYNGANFSIKIPVVHTKDNYE